MYIRFFYNKYTDLLVYKNIYISIYKYKFNLLKNLKIVLFYNFLT